MESTENNTSTVYELGIETELRIVINDERNISAELLSGCAEIFGSELELNTVYTFHPYSCIPLFTWQGCKVRLTGKAANVEVTTDSLIMLAVKIHSCLEEHRMMASENSVRGPVCIVTGTVQSGKSSFCLFLANYAARMGRNPFYVDLDILQNRSLMPGTMSVFQVQNQSDVTEGFSKHSLSVHAFGHTNLRKHNTQLFFLLVQHLGNIIRERLSKDKPDGYNSGVIIDGTNWGKRKQYKAVMFAAYAFKIDVVFVLSGRSLFFKLRKDMPPCVEVVYLPKQKGIVERHTPQLERMETNLISRYFYGSDQNPLVPYKFDVSFSDIQIYSTVKSSTDKNCCARFDDVDIYRVPLDANLINKILGLSYADKFDKNVLVSNVIGFVSVIGIDRVKNVIKVLSPQPAPLPSKILILFHVRFDSRNECSI